MTAGSIMARRLGLGVVIVCVAMLATLAPPVAHAQTTTTANLSGSQDLSGVTSAESMLVSAMKDIAANRVAAAHEKVDAVLKLKPNFRLAQLVKGDLLAARAGEVKMLGASDTAQSERLEDLRAEAAARLRRMNTPVPRDRVPSNLLRLSPEQKYALVVDTSRSTLYVFENDNGVPRYIKDYYSVIGKNGVEKLVEGDKRTPLGVYHVVRRVAKEKLIDLYGSGAFPLNYPNEWDKRYGRRGHGIWLHGTPKNTYSRPPRASDGCVVLTNDELDELAPRLQFGLTPVVIADQIDWIMPRQMLSSRAELEGALERWRSDWESLQMDVFLRHYSPNFVSGKIDLARWQAEKKRVHNGKTWVKVSLTDVSMFLYPGREQLALVTFTQNYSSNNLSNVTKKRQFWIREGDHWNIAYEGDA